MTRPVLVMAALLAGCAGLQSSDPASPYYAYSHGWTAELRRALTIPADAATVRLQYGRIVPRNGVQEHDPFCIVEVNDVTAAPQQLQPARFEIWRVTRSVSTLTATAASPLLHTWHGHDDPPSFLYYITEFRLRDPAQPGVRSLRCAWNQMAPGNVGLMRHLTVAEMQAALGDWIRLRPPGGAV